MKVFRKKTQEVLNLEISMAIRYCNISKSVCLEIRHLDVFKLEQHEAVHLHLDNTICYSWVGDDADHFKRKLQYQNEIVSKSIEWLQKFDT